MRLTLECIDRWDSSSIAEVGRAAADRGRATRATADQLGAVLGTVRWDGHAADAARPDMWQTRLEMYRHADECESVARGVLRSVPGVRAVKEEWRAIQELAESWHIAIDTRSGSVSWVEPNLMTAKGREMLELAAKTVAFRIHELIALANRVDAELAAVLDGTDFARDGRALGFELDPRSRQDELEAERRANQIGAFRAAFDRDPVSAADWDTAAVLDPHSYEPKNCGVPPNIVVGRIESVPGQGVVRANLFIPGETAWTPAGENLGDARGFDPKAGPEQSRVTFYVDYENGVVVARQNPSVRLGTAPRTGTPQVKIRQNPNGSVLV
ncbi:MAG TPA: hypothetical protein VMD51_06880, partial [Mycobacterium sp.]|nr:hypothetical protein [Mycobacterium sp.]